MNLKGTQSITLTKGKRAHMFKRRSGKSKVALDTEETKSIFYSCTKVEILEDIDEV